MLPDINKGMRHRALLKGVIEDLNRWVQCASIGSRPKPLTQQLGKKKKSSKRARTVNIKEEEEEDT